MQGYGKSQLKTIKQYFNEGHSIILHKLKGEKKIEFSLFLFILINPSYNNTLFFFKIVQL
jgi:hypothetical protein